MNIRIITAAVLVLMTIPVWADHVAIIVNKTNQEKVSLEKVKHIYTDLVTHWENGHKVVAYHLPKKSRERLLFSKKILGISTKQAIQQMKRRRMHHRAMNVTETYRAHRLVRAVSREKDAIGYVPLAMARSEDDVRIVYTIDDPDAGKP